LLTLFETSFTCLIIGRILYGIAAGSYSVFCPKYISETAPTEIKGPAGGLSQICITFGILVPFALGLTYTDVENKTKNQNYWFIVIIFTIIPVALACLQVFLLTTVFPYDTPPIIKQNNDFISLNAFMGKIYKPEVVQSRIDELGGDFENSEDKITNIGYGAVFCNPMYRRATFVGCMLAIF
jgi:MFS family permease